MAGGLISVVRSHILKEKKRRNNFRVFFFFFFFFFVDISNLAYYNGPNRSVLPYVVVLQPGNIDE